jgi:hypothetical protein
MSTSDPSPNDTAIIPGYGFITDSSGDTFTITSNGTVDMNFSPLGYTANVIEGAYVNGHFWQENSSGFWWEYTGNPSSPWSGLGTSTSPLPAGTPVSLTFSSANSLTLPANSYSITQDLTPYQYSDPESHEVFLNAQGSTTFTSDSVTSPIPPNTDAGPTSQIVEFNNLTVDKASFYQANGSLYGQNLNNDGNFSIVDGTVSITASKIGGTGAFSMVENGFLSIDGAVNAGLSFDLGQTGTLDIGNPKEFQGSIHVSPEHDTYDVLFQGITATSFDWNGSTLMLYEGSTVAKFAFTDEYGDGGVYAYQTSQGVMISDGQPNGSTPIPGHTLTA